MSQTVTARRDTERWSIRRVVPLTEIELKALFSEGRTLVSSLLLEPAAQLVLLAAGLQGLIGDDGDFYNGHSYLMFVLPGLFGLQALRAFSRTMYRTVLDRQWGMLTIKRLAGAGGLGYTLSKIVAPSIALIVQIIMMAWIAMLMGGRFGILSFVGATVLSMFAVMFWSSLAIIVTGFVRDYVARDMIVGWMMLPLSLSAPVFYSLDTAPAYLQWIARFNPLAYQVQAIRDMLLEVTLGTPGIAMVILALVACASATISVSWGDALTSEGGR